jgi:tetratricopeptide (TPR) repeat protein
MMFKLKPMGKIPYIFILLLCSLSILLNGQSDVQIRKKDFKIKKEGFNEAWEHVQQGDSWYEKKGIWYSNAFEEYVKALVYNNSDAALNYKTGVSALLSDKKEEAAAFLLKALEINKEIAVDILFLTGRALQYEEKYPEALEKFNQYIDYPVKKAADRVAAVNKYMDECKSAIDIITDTLEIEIRNIGAGINSEYDDYSQVISGDGKTIYFASRREIKKGDKKPRGDDENIFISQFKEGQWTSAIPPSGNITSRHCETPVFISGDTLYMYAGYENEGDIKMARLKKGSWKYPQPIPFPVNSSAAETSFSISPSGKEIYFVSTRRNENYGGKDIFFIRKIKKHKWSRPENIGNVINTRFDEESVSFSRTGDTLWFSSKGHNSMGGFDIFYSVKNETGAWGSVKNAGYPVNTPWDELFFTVSSAHENLVYFVSNRKGGFGGLDIYTGRLSAFPAGKSASSAEARKDEGIDADPKN